MPGHNDTKSALTVAAALIELIIQGMVDVF